MTVYKVCCVCAALCLCVCVWLVCVRGGGGVRVCIECVSVLQCPITLHIPTCSHIKYVPLPTRVCVCAYVCASCVCAACVLNV